MASMKLGSKPEVFHLKGQSWVCSTGLASDVIVEVKDFSFHLHKFPLLLRSRVLEHLIGRDQRNCVLQLHDLPGGAKTFLLVAKFCYGVKFELAASNVVSLHCAAEYLQMSEEYGEKNLIAQTETFLNEIFSDWTGSIKALESCEEVLPFAEELNIVSRCISTLAMKVCVDPSLFSWPMSGNGMVLWNGIHVVTKSDPVSEDWWYEDASFLSLYLYKRLILAIESRGIKPEKIAGSIINYAKRHLPLCRESGFQNGSHGAPFDSDKRTLLEEIVELLPNQKNVTPTEFLLKLLRTSMILHASPSCRDSLERMIGAQLDQAAVEDIMIPNVGYSVETLYDIDCVQRILDHFMVAYQEELEYDSNSMDDDRQLIAGDSHSLSPITTVSNLVDRYLAEVAPDVNLKLSKFQSLAAVIPDYARPLEDGIYRSIDIYLKAHPWLTESEKEQLCRLMNCQKLSLEASTHAAQNERLPLRVIVQVLFFEQLRLRNSVSDWFYAAENLVNTQNLSGNLTNHGPSHSGNMINQNVTIDEMKERVSELEKECSMMKQEMEKLVKTKGGGWSIFSKRFGFRSKTSSNSSAVQASEFHDPKTSFSEPMEEEMVKALIQEKYYQKNCK